MTPARVVGAGISGLAAAWCLADRGFAVTVHERRECAGGLVGTRATEYGPVETAANAFVWSDRVAAWFDRLGLQPMFARPASRRRYFFRGGAARRWPLSLGETCGLAGRVAAAALRGRRAPRAGETVAAWGDRVLGPAARRFVLDPGVSGSFAAPAHALSARAVFGQRRRGRVRSAAPPGGMGEFTARLHARLLERGVRFEFGRALVALDPAVPTVVCTGAGDAAPLVAPHAPALGERIARVRSAPLLSATLFFEPHPADLRGFGVLFPAGEGVLALGVLFNTEIFEGRGARRSETWIVGERDGAVGGAGIPATDAELLLALAADRRALTGRSERPLDAIVTRWVRAVPIYDQAILDVVAALSTPPPWLALAGNYLGRLGAAHLLDLAGAAAASLAARHRAPRAALSVS